MRWLARLMELDDPRGVCPTKPTKGPSVGFVGTDQGPFPDIGNYSELRAVNDAPPANDQTCIEDMRNGLASREGLGTQCSSLAMSKRELDLLLARMRLFQRMGIRMDQAEEIADKLVRRDRELDDRRLCLECIHLYGNAKCRCCTRWHDLGRISGPEIPRDLVGTLQRCSAFVARLPSLSFPQRVLTAEQSEGGKGDRDDQSQPLV